MKKLFYAFLAPALAGAYILSYGCLADNRCKQIAEVPSRQLTGIKTVFTQAEYELLEKIRIEEQFLEQLEIHQGLLEGLIQKAYDESREQVRKGQLKFLPDIPNFDRT